MPGYFADRFYQVSTHKSVTLEREVDYPCGAPFPPKHHPHPHRHTALPCKSAKVVEVDVASGHHQFIGVAWCVKGCGPVCHCTPLPPAMVISERVWDTTVEGDPAANPMHLGTSEIKETPDHFYVKVDWHKHGVAPNRVAGHHEGRDLVIRCEHEAGSQLKEVVTYVKTDHADVLERRVRIPENVDLTKYEEHYKNGEFWAKYSKVKEPIFHTWKC